MESPLLFGWLADFIKNFFAVLRGWQVVSGVSMYGLLLAVCLLIVLIRGLLLKR